MIPYVNIWVYNTQYGRYMVHIAQYGSMCRYTVHIVQCNSVCFLHNIVSCVDK